LLVLPQTDAPESLVPTIKKATETARAWRKWTKDDQVFQRLRTLSLRFKVRGLSAFESRESTGKVGSMMAIPGRATSDLLKIKGRLFEPSFTQILRPFPLSLTLPHLG
jgi:hypothetical protein